MKKYIIRISFHFSYNDIIQDFIIHVPDNVELEDIKSKINEKQTGYLFDDDKIIGDWEPEDIVVDACKENGWKCEKFFFDEELSYSL